MTKKGTFLFFSRPGFDSAAGRVGPAAASGSVVG